MRKCISLVCILLCLMLAMPAISLAEGLSVESPAGTVRPGQAVIIAFDAPDDGSARITVMDGDRVIAVIAEDYGAWAGRNSLYWNGTWNGARAEEGVWQLTVTMNSETAAAPVTIGPAAPFLTDAALRGDLTPGSEAILSVYASMDGTLSLYTLRPMGDGTAQRSQLLETPVTLGVNEVPWTVPAEAAEGRLTLKAALTDADGVTSEELTLTFMAMA